jgi:hypothetical protein
MIPTKVHGFLDYLVGLLLITAPWLFGFAAVSPASLIAIALGTITVFYSLITNYELGIIPLISFKVHLILDLLSGAILFCAPWIFNFSEYVRWPHVTLGLLEIIVVLLSKRPKRK